MSAFENAHLCPALMALGALAGAISLYLAARDLREARRRIRRAERRERLLRGGWRHLRMEEQRLETERRLHRRAADTLRRLLDETGSPASSRARERKGGE